MDEQGELNRLKWRSRRGMLELDLLLVPFCNEVYPDLDEAMQQTFRELLEQDDPDLLAWFSRNGRPEDDSLAALVEYILDRVQPD